jgi:peptidoglycan/LPS O-acetylase OafA/YrhL
MGSDVRLRPGDRGVWRSIIQSPVSATRGSSALCDVPDWPAAQAAVSARPQSVAAKTGKSARVLGYDVVRALAAMGVIWVHAGRSTYWMDHNLSFLGSWGTSYLNTLAGFFVAVTFHKHVRVESESSSSNAAIRFAGHRVWRLYGAFVIWSGIYVAARVVNYALFHKVTMLGWSWDLFFFGTTYHLWFLPYLLIVTLVTLPVVEHATRSRQAMVATSVVLALIAITLEVLPEPTWFITGGHSTLMAFQLYSRAPGFLLGLAFGLWMLAGVRPALKASHAVVCAAIVVLTMTATITTEFPRHILNRLGAIAAFVVALGPWHGSIARFLGAMGKLGFGVYLCHVLFVESLIALGGRLRLEPSLEVDIAVFALSVMCSFTMAWLMRQTRWLAWLIP